MTRKRKTTQTEYSGDCGGYTFKVGITDGALTGWHVLLPPRETPLKASDLHDLGQMLIEAAAEAGYKPTREAALDMTGRSQRGRG